MFFTTFVERFWKTGRLEYVIAKVPRISKSERRVVSMIQ